MYIACFIIFLKTACYLLNFQLKKNSNHFYNNYNFEYIFVHRFGNILLCLNAVITSDWHYLEMEIS